MHWMKRETDLTSVNNLITIAPKVFLITICFWPAGSITKFSKKTQVFIGGVYQIITATRPLNFSKLSQVAFKLSVSKLSQCQLKLL